MRLSDTKLTTVNDTGRWVYVSYELAISSVYNIKLSNYVFLTQYQYISCIMNTKGKKSHPLSPKGII